MSMGVTHAHAEGQAGAMAVAVAASIAASQNAPGVQQFLSEVIQHVPESETQDGIELARRIPARDFDSAVKQLGTGWNVSAQDTVPFCLWCAAHHLADYEKALWHTVAGGGDRDTTCAMVGGIVALSVGKVPEEWISRREPLPEDFAI